MNKDLKKWGAILTLGIIISIMGYFTNEQRVSELENKEKIQENTSNEILMARREAEFKEENTIRERNIEDNLNKIIDLENILNDKYFILINKQNKLSEDYEPIDLKKSEVKFEDYVQDDTLEVKTADAVKAMFDKAKEAGVSLVGVSGYRSYSVQKGLYESRVQKDGEERTQAYTAEPGASEHQSGLAIDILCDEYPYLDVGFEETEAFKWLFDNCYKYGFILRYIEGKENITGYNYEPWHFRYIGNPEIAEDIMKRGIVFEEYIEELKGKIEELKK